MATSVKVTGRLISPDLEKNLKIQIRDQTEDALEVIRENLIERTRSGKSISGTAFPRYTERYAKQRQKEGLPTSPPDLTVSGALLNTITTKVTMLDKGVNAEMRIAPSQETKARSVSKKRPFFGFTKKDEEALRKALKLDLEEANG